MTICEKCKKPIETGECFCDLNLDLSTPAVEPIQDEEGFTEEEKKLLAKLADKQAQTDLIMQGFTNLKDRPSEEQIQEWKNIHGKVFTIGFDESEFYVFRPLKRLEWRNLMSALTKQPDELKKKEAVVMRAVLWPRMDAVSIGGGLAGTPESLYDVVLQASNFLLPQEAIACVRRL